MRTLPLLSATHAVMTPAVLVCAMAAPPTTVAVKAALAMVATMGDFNLLTVFPSPAARHGDHPPANGTYGSSASKARARARARRESHDSALGPSASGAALAPLGPGRSHVRDLIGLRRARLSEGTNRILEVASVVGVEFCLQVLERAGGAQAEPLLDFGRGSGRRPGV
jgi:hypothetical protein